MADDSQRVDTYIQNAPVFARPILTKIRTAFHKGCPDVEEAIKWGCPHFLYHGMLGGMAAFKGHVSFGFWKSRMLEDPANLFDSGTGRKASMCNARFRSVNEVPRQSVLVEYVKRAVKLNEDDSRKDSPKSSAAKKNSTRVPADLSALFKNHIRAKATFDALAPSHKRDYVNWISEAKREATRKTRLALAIEWLNEGKRRHWKYESKK